MKMLFAATVSAVVLLAGSATAQIVHLPSAQQGVAYSSPIASEFFMGETFAAIGAPPGLGVTGSEISGTPTAVGTYDFTITISGYAMSTCMEPGPFPMPYTCAIPVSRNRSYRLEVAPAPVAIPTMSEWAMILLGVLLAGGAALTIQRRRTV